MNAKRTDVRVSGAEMGLSRIGPLFDRAGLRNFGISAGTNVGHGNCGCGGGNGKPCACKRVFPLKDDAGTVVGAGFFGYVTASQALEKMAQVDTEFVSTNGQIITHVQNPTFLASWNSLKKNWDTFYAHTKQVLGGTLGSWNLIDTSDEAAPWAQTLAYESQLRSVNEAYAKEVPSAPMPTVQPSKAGVDKKKTDGGDDGSAWYDFSTSTIILLTLAGVSVVGGAVWWAMRSQRMAAHVASRALGE